MLKNFNKNMINIFKQIPEQLFSFTSKSVIYFGLAIYWGVILWSTIINII